MKKNNVELIVQTELITLLIIFLIVSFFIKEFITMVELLSSFTLITMAYNNYKIFNKKKLTIVYLVIGIVFLITSIFDYIKVV